MSTHFTAFERRLKTLDRPYALLLIGVPGSGKSTWLKQHQDYLKSPAIIGTDKLLEEWAASVGVTYSDAWNTLSMRDLEKAMWAELEAAVAAGRNVVIDRTNVSRKVRNKVLCKLPEHYVRLAAVFTVERDELRLRLDERNKTGKIISEAVVEDMLSRYEEPTLDEFDTIFR